MTEHFEAQQRQILPHVVLSYSELSVMKNNLEFTGRHGKSGSVVLDLQAAHLHPYLYPKALNPDRGQATSRAGVKYEPQGHLRHKVNAIQGAVSWWLRLSRNPVASQQLCALGQFPSPLLASVFPSVKWRLICSPTFHECLPRMKLIQYAPNVRQCSSRWGNRSKANQTPVSALKQLSSL